MPAWLTKRGFGRTRPGADPLPHSRGGRPPAAGLSPGHRVAAPGEGGPARPYLGGQRGARRPPSPSRRPRQPRRHLAPLAGATRRGGQCPAPARPGLPSPVRRKDSLLFCASARFLWRGRSSDSRRARASAPCISPMASGGAEHWRFLEGAAVTRAGRASCPRPQTNKWPLCAARPLPKTPFLCFWPKPSKAEKNPRTWTGRKEGKREGRGRERSGMCRGGGGAEIKLVSALKGKKSTIRISLFPPLKLSLRTSCPFRV